MTRLSKSSEQMKNQYDVVIIGSGYGGGVSACRLAEKSKEVCVLEKGKEWLTGEFPARFPDIKSQLHMTGGKVETGPESALFQFKMGKHIHILTGGGLGGGSLINAAVALQPDDHVFTSNEWPEDFRKDLSLIHSGYNQARKELRPAQDINAEELIKYKALKGAEEAFDTTVKTTPVVINFDDEGETCTRCGDCCSGCNVGAKNTVALTYLPKAAKAGADIFTETAVQYVSASSDGGWDIHYRASDDKKADIHVVSADKVIFAAGTLGTAEILLRSREKGLTLSDQLGHGFSANGDIIAFGYDAKEKVHAVGVGHPSKIETDPVGASVSGHLDLKDDKNPDHSMIIEEGVLPSALAPLLPVFFVPGGRLLGALKSLIKGVYDGPLSRTQTFFAVSHDDAEGQLKMEKDRIFVDWPHINKQPVYERVDKALEKTTGAIGGKYVKNPLASTVMGAIPATAHPLGGCAMGNNTADGVVNHKCEVFSNDSSDSNAVHKGLYICDGSVIPRSLGVNPLLTITAVTERAMALFED